MLGVGRHRDSALRRGRIRQQPGQLIGHQSLAGAVVVGNPAIVVTLLIGWRTRVRIVGFGRWRRVPGADVHVWAMVVMICERCVKFRNFERLEISLNPTFMSSPV